MTMLSAQEAQQLLQKVLDLSRADEMEASLTGGRSAYTRFGVNSANTSGDREDLSLAVTARFGQRSGVATTNTLDQPGLERVVRAAEEIARLRPEDPEQQPFLGKQQYTPVDIAFDEATYRAAAPRRAQSVAATINPARAKNLVAAGLFEHSGGFQARANTRGNFGYAKNSLSSFTTTVRTADGSGSGWASAASHRIIDVNARAVAARAIEKAERSRAPVALEPGNYTVILEPAAAAALISNMIGFFGARTADEGRSFLSRKGGGNLIGEKLFGDRVNIYTDPGFAAAPGAPFDDEGLPARRMDFVRGGVVRNLNYTRYWATRQSTETKSMIEPTPAPTNIIIDGGDASLAEMIRDTERGVLVTRFWYIRLVDAQTVLYTGLTRDGTFLIEKGRLKQAIKNFRFNETPVKMLNNIEAMSPPVRIGGEERPMIAPAIKVREFEFTSLSDAV